MINTFLFLFSFYLVWGSLIFLNLGHLCYFRLLFKHFMRTSKFSTTPLKVMIRVARYLLLYSWFIKYTFLEPMPVYKFSTIVILPPDNLTLHEDPIEKQASLNLKLVRAMLVNTFSTGFNSITTRLSSFVSLTVIISRPS